MLRLPDRLPKSPPLSALVPLAAARALGAFGYHDVDARTAAALADNRAAAAADLARLMAVSTPAIETHSGRILRSIPEDAVALRGPASVTLFNAVELARELAPANLVRTALALNEIVLNALVHAHPSGAPLLLDVWCRNVGSVLALDVRDDGVGLPVQGHAEGFGLGLARRLMAEMGGRLDVVSTPLGLNVRARAELPELAEAAGL